MFFLFACQNGSEYKEKKIFRYNESKNISTLDPAFARNQIIMRPVNQLFNGLVQLDNKLIVKPCIADSWAISADGKKYTFFLRTDVDFHPHKAFINKSRKVKASDFVYSFNRIVDEKTASPGRWIFNQIDVEKKDTDKGFRVINDSVLEIYLKTPFPGFLGILTMPYCSVVPHEVVEMLGKDFGRSPIGTGPFKFKKWRENEKLVLIKNDKYFERDSNNNRLPYLDAIAITFVSDLQSEFMEFMKGRFDIIIGMNSNFKDELLDKRGEQNRQYASKFSLLKSSYLNTEYLAFNVDSSKLKGGDRILLNPKIRAAINLGIDKAKMISYLRNNIGDAAIYGFVPLGMPQYDNTKVKGNIYNPQKALQLLNEAGYPSGKGLPKITLTTTTDYADLCEFIQHQLSEIGILIEIEIANGATFKEMVANSKLCFFRGSWVADYPDPENYFSLFYSKNFSPAGPNYSHFSNRTFDKLYEQSLFTTVYNERLNFYYQMDSLIMSENVVVPLFYDKTLIFISKKVDGLVGNPLNTLNLKCVSLE